MPPKVAPPRIGIPLGSLPLAVPSVGMCGCAAYAMSQSNGLISPPLVYDPGIPLLRLPFKPNPPTNGKLKELVPLKPTNVKPPPLKKPLLPPAPDPMRNNKIRGKKTFHVHKVLIYPLSILTLFQFRTKFGLYHKSSVRRFVIIFSAVQTSGLPLGAS